MKRLKTLIFGIAVMTLVLFLPAVAQADSIFNVTLDTSPLIGSSYWITFDLIDGDWALNNTATISNFQFMGGNPVGPPLLVGGAAGDLSTSVMLNDSFFFNEFSQAFNPGSLLSFDVQLTTNFAGGIPDSFSFLLLDDFGLPIPTLDPLWTDVFLAVDLDSSSPVIQTFATDTTRTPISIDAPNVTIVPVPEPGTCVLIGSGLLFLFGYRSLGKRRSR